MNKNYRLKISRPGVDVRFAEPEDCLFHSDFINPKVQPLSLTSSKDSTYGTGVVSETGFGMGTFDYEFTSDPGYGVHNLLTINHNLGYVPACLCFATDLSNDQQVQLPIRFNFSGYEYLQARSKENTFKIDLVKVADTSDLCTDFGFCATYPNLTGLHFLFKWMLLVEPGA